MKALKFRIVVENPVPGVACGVQSGSGGAGRAAHVQITSNEDLQFQIEVALKPADSGFRLSGPYIQRDSAGPFIYLCWGTSAGDARSTWTRRTKLYLDSLSSQRLASSAESGEEITIRVFGRAKDGGPCCAKTAVRIS